MNGQGFRIGEWTILPEIGQIQRGAETNHLEPKVMDVLVHLARHPGKVCAKNQILDAVWPDTFVGDDVLVRVIVELRKAFSDHPRNPTYIETIPKRGYRLIAQVSPAEDPTRSGGELQQVQIGRTPVEDAHGENSPGGPAVGGAARPWTSRRIQRWKLCVAGLGVLIIASLLGVRLLRDDWWTAADQKAAVPPAQMTSIAVLPFENFSGNPEQDYFVRGMTDAIITDLSGIASLRVISRTSAELFQGSGKSIPEIAGELGADAIVEGSVLRVGNRVRITAQLVDGVADRNLWAEGYVGDLEDILALQSEISRAVAREIGAVISTDEARFLAESRPVDPEAYQLYLKGNFELENLSEHAFQRAIRLYEEAIRLDPEYAPPYAGLAVATTELAGWHSSRPPEGVVDGARDAALRALELDPRLAEAHIALANLRRLFEWDWEGAEAAFRRGLQLRPGFTYARILYANHLTSLGRFQESIDLGRETLAMDPLSPAACNELGFALETAGRLEEALEYYLKALELDPDSVQSRGVTAQHLLRRGRIDEALRHIEVQLRLVDQRRADSLGLAGYAFGKTGRIEEALGILNQLRNRRKEEYVSAVALAYVSLGLDKKEQALDWLEKAYEERNAALVWLKVLWIYDPLRSDPRFQHLVGRMNFPG